MSRITHIVIHYSATYEDQNLTVKDIDAMWQAAAENQSAHVFAADILKRQDPIPADYTDDRHWP